MTDIAVKRTYVQSMLSTHSPADALASYYALHHNPDRTSLFLHENESGQTDGFLVRAHTGMDLFTPTVTMRAKSDQAAATLFRIGLISNRPYYVLLPPELEAVAAHELEITALAKLHVYCLESKNFRHIINALVQPNTDLNGLLRFEIRSKERALSSARVIWQSQYFAEISVSTVPEARRRGWGRSVVSALANELVQMGIQPIYVTTEDNPGSIRIAQAVGFVDTGARIFSGSATRPSTH